MLPIRVLAFDPGLKSTGWGVVDNIGGNYKYVAHGCFETLESEPDGLRLRRIYLFTEKLAAQVKPDIVVLELAPGMSMALAKSDSTGNVRGVIKMALPVNTPVMDETARTMRKKLTGHASMKAQVIQGKKVKGSIIIDRMVRVQVVRRLRLPEIPTPIHGCEALAHAIAFFIPRPEPAKKSKKKSWKKKRC